MRARVHVIETYHHALRLRGLEPRSPIGLDEQAVAADRNAAQRVVKQLFCRNAETLRLVLFVERELIPEPRDHPKAAEDLNLGIVFAVDDRRICRHERLRLDIFVRRHLDGSGGAQGDAGDIPAYRAVADRLADLVRARRDHRYALGDAGRLARFARDRADLLPRAHELAHLVDRTAEDAIVERVLGHPLALFVVVGEARRLSRGRVGEPTGQLEVVPRGGHDDLGGLLPHLGLVDPDPIGVAGAALYAHHLAHADSRIDESLPKRQRIGTLDLALVHP